MQVYLPNLIIANGQGAMIPILVFAAKSVGASPAVAGAIVAVNGFGTMAFDLPAGRIVARVGEWRGACVAAGMLVVGLIGCLVANSVLVLAIAVFVQAAGWALWNLVRLSHLSRVAPPFARGRALGIFGGITRAGNVVGPLVYVVLANRNAIDVGFALYLACVVVGFTWQILARDRVESKGAGMDSTVVHPFRVLVTHRRELSTAGVGAFGISLLRGSRNALVPLWAAHIGLDATTAAALFAWSSLVDLALFYPASVASDYWGRRAVALPCILMLAVGHFLIPLTDSYWTLFWVALLLGVGNGMGSGIVMTLGADLAPGTGRASFFGVWRCVADGGTAVGPLVDSGVVAVASIVLAGPVVGVLGLLTATVVGIWVKDPGQVVTPGAG
jgi:MFS family permease